MKMSKDFYNTILLHFKENEDLIRNYAKDLKETGKYNNFETRLSFDVFYGLIDRKTKDKYRNEDLKDSHIETGLKKALREINVI